MNDIERHTPNSSGTSGSSGLPQEIAMILVYLLGWVGGLIFILIEKENRFVRFHAMQSIVLSVAATVVTIALNILSIIPFLGIIVTFVVLPLFGLALLALVIFLIIKTSSGQDVRLPVIADIADKWLGAI